MIFKTIVNYDLDDWEDAFYVAAFEDGFVFCDYNNNIIKELHKSLYTFENNIHPRYRIEERRLLENFL